MVDINEGSVCLNHPDTPAIGRCCVCRKPVCDQCAIRADGQIFCSEKCREDAQRTDKLVKTMESGKARSQSRARIRAVFWLIVIALLAWGAWYYVKNKDSMDRKVENLKEKAVELKNEGVQKLKK